MTTPDETPRATLREDERAVAEVVATHAITLMGNCLCGWGQQVYALHAHAAHVAEQIAPLVAAARAEAWREGAAAGHHSPLTWFALRQCNPHAARIARTAPSTDQTGETKV